jgi:GNAT superfamily N-acetyltransferase
MTSDATATTIEEAVPADIDFLRAAFTELVEEMRELAKAAGCPREGSYGPNLDLLLQRDTFLVAAHRDEPCGFLSVWFPCPPAGRALVPVRQPALIDTVYVRPAFRRQGIGSKLLDAVESRCRSWGALGIVLGFIEGNHAAEAAYTKAGYVLAKREMWRSLDDV